MELYRPTLAEILSDTELTVAEIVFKDCCKSGEIAVIGKTRPTEATDTNTIRASLIRHAMLEGCDDMPVSLKGVRIKGAWITGALDLQNCVCVLDLVLGSCKICEQPVLKDAQLGLVSLAGCEIPGLSAHRVATVRGMLLNKGFISNGTVDLSSAKIGGTLDCVEGHFNWNSEVADKADKDRKEKLALSCNGATIGADVFFCTTPGQKVHLRKTFKAEGRVELIGAKIGGQLNCEGGVFGGDGVVALECDAMIVGADVFFRNTFIAEGGVSLTNAKIAGDLRCAHAVFDGWLDCEGTVVHGRFFWQEVRRQPLELDLVDAQVGSLRDDKASWKDCIPVLNGFRYDRIISDMSVRDRLKWLGSAQSKDIPVGKHTHEVVPDIIPQPYTQLARALDVTGQRRGAALVRYERERLVRPAENAKLLLEAEHSDNALLEVRKIKLQRASDIAFKYLFGYGHLPLRVLWSVFGIWLFSCWLYGNAYYLGQMAPNSSVVLTSPEWLAALKDGCAAGRQAGCELPLDIWLAGETAKDYESFNRGLYALDLFVPLDALGQENAWAPSKIRGWWGWWAYSLRWVVQMSGWVITAVGAAALTGVIGRKE